MKLYLLTVYQPEGSPAGDPERITRQILSFHAELHAAGAWVFAGGLHASSTATVVRAHGDSVFLTDGSINEHIAGVCIIRAPDLDAALEWGHKAAQATALPIEVRAFQGEVD